MKSFKTRSEFYDFAKRLAYGKRLAAEALNITFRDPVTRRWKPFPERSHAESLSILFNECSRWSPGDWLSMNNWKKLHDGLSKVVLPDLFQKRGFKLQGVRAGVLGRETLDFIKQMSSKWKSLNRSSSLRADIQNSIDLLEMMIQENIVEASLRKEWIKQLVVLCKKYKYMPKALELQNLKFARGAEISLLDVGGSSDIMLAEMEGKKVVVKVLRADKAIRMEMKKRKWSALHEEALNWVGLDYPGLNPFLGITLKHPRGNIGIGLVFKFQELGNSVKYLEKNRVDRSDFIQAKAFYLIGTIHYLHQMGLVHSDIKGANILVDESESLVLTDFGLMLRTLLQSPDETPTSITESSTSTGSTSLSGDYSLRFSSRERVLEGKRSEADDIWALGMTLIELLTGKPPFSTNLNLKNDLWFLGSLLESKLDLNEAELPKSIPVELFQVIERCISPLPEDRPTTFELFTIMGQIAGSKALQGVMREGYY